MGNREDHAAAPELTERRYARRNAVVRCPMRVLFLGWLVSVALAWLLAALLAPQGNAYPYMFPGTFIAAFVGFPLAVGVAHWMRFVRNQWLHVLAFAGAGLLTPLPALLFFSWIGGMPGLLMLGLLLGPPTALCAAVGRLAIWRGVEVEPLPEDEEGPGDAIPGATPSRS